MSDLQQVGYEFCGFRLLPGQRQLLAPDGTPVAIGNKAFELLVHLVRNRGQLVEKSELLHVLWPRRVVEENNLNQAMSALRQALGETAQSPRCIATVTGRGYQFVADVHEYRPGEDDVARTALRLPAPRLLLGGAVVILAAIGLHALTRDGPGQGVPVLDRFDTLTPQLVAGLPGSHSDPTLSPDGSLMAWVSSADGVPQIHVKNLQLGDPIRVTDGNFAASSPSWSPDNRRILYARNKPGGGSAIYSVGTFGTPPPRLLIDNGSDPSFAGQRDTLVFARGQQLWVASSDGRDTQQLQNIPTGAGFARRMPALSPDAGLVAFVHAAEGPLGNLWVAPTDGGAARQLTNFQLDELVAVVSPTFSPDGHSIVYGVAQQEGGTRLERIEVDGTGQVVLAHSTGDIRHPAVSRDGTRMAYTDTRDRWLLTRVDIDTGARKTVFESRRRILLPQVAPDGTQLVFFSPLPAGAQLFTIGIDGQNLQQRTDDAGGMNTLPFWSQDGQSIYYYRGRALHRLHLDEGRDELLLEDFHWSSRNWPAVHGWKLAFQEFGTSVAKRRTLIRDLASGSEVELPVHLEGLSWSRDGRRLLGFSRPPGEIAICDTASISCRAVLDYGGMRHGPLPRWSRNEREVYYLRTQTSGDCCSLWAVRIDGSDDRPVAELPGFEPENSFYDVAADGSIIYNHRGPAADEIWLVMAD